MKIDVCISGGSIECLCTGVGFLKALEDLNLDIETMGGNSAGGLLACVYSVHNGADFLEKLVLNTRFNKFVGLGIINKIRLLFHGYLSTGEKLEQFLKRLLGDATFSTINRDLYIAGYNYTKMQPEIFSKNTTPDMPLWVAARITSCLPAALKGFVWQGDSYRDGGIAHHYPLSAIPKKNMLIGYLLGHSHDKEEREDVPEKPGAVGELSLFVNNVVDANVHADVEATKKTRSDFLTIAYDDAKISSYDFAMTKSEKVRLVSVAYEKTKQKVSEFLIAYNLK